LFDGRWRASVEQGLKPVGSSIRRSGVTADHLTGLGLVVAGACAVAIGTGRLGLGLALLIAAAIPDLLDGAVAKASGTASPRGAFFDSVADRISDSLVLGGVAWYLAGEHGGRAALLPFAVLAASTLISYERARAESLGYTARGGLMERAERIVALCLGLLLSELLVPILWVMLVLTIVTAAHRFVKVWRQASAPRAESRWRTWREVAALRPRSARQGEVPQRWRTRRRSTERTARRRWGAGTRP
jgi:CDP-diacylglycerol---glycerol-3-phosphate 3-phosphatidyltransferase